MGVKSLLFQELLAPVMIGLEGETMLETFDQNVHSLPFRGRAGVGASAQTVLASCVPPSHPTC